MNDSVKVYLIKKYFRYLGIIVCTAVCAVIGILFLYVLICTEWSFWDDSHAGTILGNIMFFFIAANFYLWGYQDILEKKKKRKNK